MCRCWPFETGCHSMLVLVAVALVLVLCASIGHCTDDLDVSTTPTDPVTCFTSDHSDTQVKLNASQTAALYVESSHRFAVQLLQMIFNRSDEKTRNVFFSPHSLWTTLTLTYLGAAGSTRDQMARAMALQNFTSSGQILRAYKFVHYWYQMRNTRVANRTQQLPDMPVAAAETPLAKNRFNVANRIYFDKSETIEPCLSTLLNDIIKTVDFTYDAETARQSINRWVSNRTADRVRDLIPVGFVDSSTRMVLANAAYFKGTWLSQFDKQKTTCELFYSARDDFTFVKMMAQKGQFNYGVSEELQSHILELPYRGEEISLFVLLPPFSDGALTRLIRLLTPQSLKQTIGYMWPTEMTVKLPKFRIEGSYDMSDILIDLGFSDLFDSARVNLTGFSPSGHLTLSGALHKSFLQIDEEGAEAAAATVLITSRTSRPLNPSTFHCNHPFLYVIYDKVLDNIMFVGTFERPSVAELFLHNDNPEQSCSS